MTQTAPSPRFSVCEGSAALHREVGERGRRPEHPDCPGSGYCGRGCHHPHIHFLVPARWHRAGRQTLDCLQAGFLSASKGVVADVPRADLLHYLGNRPSGAGELDFFAAHRHLHEPAVSLRYLAPVWNTGTAEQVGTLSPPLPLTDPDVAGFPHPVPHERDSARGSVAVDDLDLEGSGCRARSSLKRTHRTTP